MRLWLTLVILLLPFTAAATDFTSQMRELEHKAGGRIGVAALNTADGQYLEYKAGERFALCSTFKLLLVADVLSRIDAGSEQLEREISYGQADLQHYSPLAEKHLREGKMSVADLSAAAIEYSDNTAANLLLKTVGGPEGLTKYVRTLGDSKTRIDRFETALSSNLRGDPLDTTTPSAMVQSMRVLLVEDALSSPSKERLIGWLKGNTTGDARLRAGISPGWKIGDKTGSGDNGATNDIAIVWPPSGKPFLIAVYYSESTQSQDKRNAVIADVGRIVSTAFFGR